MHGVHKLVSVLWHIYALGVETCLSFRAYLCMGCINVPQIQGIFLHGVHNVPQDLGQINEIPDNYGMTIRKALTPTEWFEGPS